VDEFRFIFDVFVTDKILTSDKVSLKRKVITKKQYTMLEIKKSKSNLHYTRL